MSIRSRLAALPFVLALALLGAAPAQAHSELIASVPGDGAVMSQIPNEVVLEFNEEVQQLGHEIVVVDGFGETLNDGDLIVDGRFVTQPLAWGSGVVTVTWRVVSSDGHPISGEFTYEVVPPTTFPPDEPTESGTATTTEATSEPATSTEVTSDPTSVTTSQTSDAEDPDGSSGLTPLVLAGVGALLVAAAVVTVILVRRRRNAS